MLKLGTKVKIINIDKLYSIFIQAAKLMELKNYCSDINVNEVGIIVAKTFHPHVSELVIYGVDINGRQCIISETGLKRIVDYDKWYDSLTSEQQSDLLELIDQGILTRN